ncbi:metal-dependent hydrolase [Acidisphaera sp. L21]|uniref:metal-dependent hydrolase n=1 Tax=Acidisphaera sp. L21 TaxID=1641851 RepID=UPI0020B15025|nr:metal-dependent hydrolase [Acidisphaera sp. L21]
MAHSHVAIGVVAWIAAAPLLHLPAADPLLLGLAMAGALLPDVDHPQSWVGRRVRPISTGVAAVLGHRGVTHSALAVVGLVWALAHAGVRQPAASALAVGYLSHLAADMLTPAGLRLAWPARWHWGLPICPTGSLRERVLVIPLACLLGWWLLSHGRWR